ncbi:MAG: hypothetical protein MZU97_16610 [Bacillus subtilis]|nr:hypothetical protein [Bacillus subtilis]
MTSYYFAELLEVIEDITVQNNYRLMVLQLARQQGTRNEVPASLPAIQHRRRNLDFEYDADSRLQESEHSLDRHRPQTHRRTFLR